MIRDSGVLPSELHRGKKKHFSKPSDKTSSTTRSSATMFVVDMIWADLGPLASENSDQMIRFNLFRFLTGKKCSSICPEKSYRKFHSNGKRSMWTSINYRAWRSCWSPALITSHAVFQRYTDSADRRNTIDTTLQGQLAFRDANVNLFNHASYTWISTLTVKMRFKKSLRICEYWDCLLALLLLPPSGMCCIFLYYFVLVN